MDRILYSGSESETESIAVKFAREIGIGNVIALSGNLGVGKTVFARGFARGLGVEDIISSPTFNLIKEYHIENDTWFFHLDLYRINDSDAALAFGVDEYISDKQSVVMIEWAERIKELLPPYTICINILRKSDKEREIRIHSKGFQSHLEMDT